VSSRCSPGSTAPAPVNEPSASWRATKMASNVSVSISTDAGDHKPLLAAELPLDPSGASAPGEVARTEALGDDALEPELLDAGEEILVAFDDQARRRPPGGAVEGEFLELRSPLRVREDAPRAAVEVEEIERLEHRRTPSCRRTGETVVQPGEVRSAIRAEADQLAVERDPSLAERVGDLRQLGEVRRALAAVARAQRNGTSVIAKLRAAAVPLHLKRPRVAGGQRPRGAASAEWTLADSRCDARRARVPADT
jgi:hypothetical protein